MMSAQRCSNNGGCCLLYTSIIKRANEEAELSKKRAMDEVKQEMITVASMMAAKVVAANIDATVQDTLVEETLKEMGDSTWQS